MDSSITQISKLHTLVIKILITLTKVGQNKSHSLCPQEERLPITVKYVFAMINDV